MTIVPADLHWPAVLVATFAYFAIGGLWYAPKVFGNRWMASIGWDDPPDKGFGPSFYLGPAATCFVASLSVAVLAAATDTSTVAGGVTLGLLVGVGLVGSALFVTGYFDPKKPQPMVWFAITASYHLVGLLAASVIIASWS